MTILSREIYTNSEEETFSLGKSMGKKIPSKLIVGFKGDLGSGKTIFIKGILAGLGYDPKRVTSTSFVLAQEYKAKIPVVHVDLYRFSEQLKAEDIDWDYYITKDSLVLIEWAEKLKDFLNFDITIDIKFISENTRKIYIQYLNDYAAVSSA